MMQEINIPKDNEHAEKWSIKTLRTLIAKIWSLPSEHEINHARVKSERETVMARLNDKAKWLWPGDLIMQNNWIISQIEAFEYMQSVENSPLKEKAQHEWPLDYTIQKFWYNERLGQKSL